MAADACAGHGLSLPGFSARVAEQLRSASRRGIRINNPLDVTASATEEEYEKVLQILAEDEANDAVLVLSIPPVIVGRRAIRDVIQQVAPAFRERSKPLIVCYVGQPVVHNGHEGSDVPVYSFPEEAVSALAHAAEYSAWLRKPKGDIPRFPDIRRKKARSLIERAMTGTSGRPFWLSATEAAELLGHYGIRTVKTAFASSANRAADEAAAIGFPVAVKLASTTIAHKTELDGVVLDVRTKKDVRQAFRSMKERLSADGREDEMDGVVIQGMVEGGVETIAGVSEDPTFGPLLMFGIGGVYTELLQDTSVRLHPLSDVEASGMIDSLRMAALLKGWRNSPPSDIKALQEMLLRLSALVEDAEEIAEIDFNPVMAMPEGEGYSVVDARIRLE